MDTKETRTKETRTKETHAKEFDTQKLVYSGVMNDVKQRLDELQELLKENYITENEYAAARINVLWEMGVDIAVHARAARTGRMSRLEARSRKALADRGYGRFAIPLLLAAVVLVCAVSLVWTLIDDGLFSLRREEPPSVISPLPSVEWSDLAALVQIGSFDQALMSFDANGGLFPKGSEDLALPPVSRDAASLDMSSLDVDEAAGEKKGKSEEKGKSIVSDLLPAEKPKENDFGTRTILGWAVVSARRVRIRSAPDTSANNVLGWAANGDRFAVLNEANGRDGSKWYNVRYEKIDGEGWIKASMMKFEGRYNESR